MIRLAESRDITRINVLRKQVNDFHSKNRPDIFKAGFAKEIADLVAAYITNEDSDVIVCERNEMIVGFAMLKYVQRPETTFGVARSYLDVNEFGVDVKYHRQGIGHEMMRWIKAHAVRRGLNRVELNMWSFNETALSFYEYEGFGTFRRYLEWVAEGDE